MRGKAATSPAPGWSIGRSIWPRAKVGSSGRSRELREFYALLGLAGKKEIVVYCQVLMRAAHSYFVLKLLGYPNVRGYDGSWAEWGNSEDTPVER